MKLLLFLVTLCVGLVQSRPGWTDVRIDNQGQCFESKELAPKLERVLRDQPDRPDLKLQVEVISSTPASGGNRVALTMKTQWGEVLLERVYDLGPADCRSVDELLVLVLERFLATFPAVKWKTLAQKAKQRPSETPRLLEVAAHLAMSGELAPSSAAGELGLLGEYGTIQHRFGISIGAKTSMPKELGQGRFMAIALVAGLRWRYAAFSWQPTLAIRAGPSLIKGFGYDINYQRWVPWLDIVASLERRWPRIALSLQLTVTALRHQILTEDDQNSAQLPIFGLGMRVTIPILARNL